MLSTIGILYGDAAGIGPEQIAALCFEKYFDGRCRPIIIGDVRVLQQGMEIIGHKFPMNVIYDFRQAKFGDAVDVLDTHNISPENYKLGEVSIPCGEAAYQDMRTALDALMDGSVQGLMYAPQNKTSFTLAGHELDSMDFMCRYLGVEKYGELNVLGNIFTSRVTSHIPLKDVSETLTTEKILDTIRFAHSCLRVMGRRDSRIAVMGLNPHNGENGLCGREEIDVIAPAVNLARESGINAAGPFSPDTLFSRAFRGEFDMVVTMYHDQGQSAMKLMGFAKAVTVIGGPQWPIATPAHGTAFDIVGKGIASLEAIKHAVDIVCK